MSTRAAPTRSIARPQNGAKTTRDTAIPAMYSATRAKPIRRFWIAWTAKNAAERPIAAFQASW
jgi:hypothetical protein